MKAGEKEPLLEMNPGCSGKDSTLMLANCRPALSDVLNMLNMLHRIKTEVDSLRIFDRDQDLRRLFLGDFEIVVFNVL